MLVDIGVNLAHRRFHHDVEVVIARALAADVRWMIVTGTSVASSREAAALAARRSDCLRATAGVHPHDAKSWSAATEGELRALAARAVAIGECGLDYDRDFSPRDVQRRVFEAQLELAADLRLPVFLHERAAHADFCALLARHRPRLVGGVVHCFTGGPDEARAYLDLDLHLGVTGWICDERRGEALRAAASLVPTERLMVETDAPFLTPRDLRPKPKDGRNEPAFLPHVVEAVARCAGRPVGEVAAATTAVAVDLFGLPR